MFNRYRRKSPLIGCFLSLIMLLVVMGMFIGPFIFIYAKGKAFFSDLVTTEVHESNEIKQKINKEIDTAVNSFKNIDYGKLKEDFSEMSETLKKVDEGTKESMKFAIEETVKEYTQLDQYIYNKYGDYLDIENKAPIRTETEGMVGALLSGSELEAKYNLEAFEVWEIWEINPKYLNLADVSEYDFVYILNVSKLKEIRMIVNSDSGKIIDEVMDQEDYKKLLVARRERVYLENRPGMGLTERIRKRKYGY